MPWLRQLMGVRLSRLFLIVAVAIGSFAWATDLLRAGVETEQNFKAVLKFLRPAIGADEGGGRISYSTNCFSRDADVIPFPKVKLEPPLVGTKGFNAVRSIFRGDKAVEVIRDASGITKITIGKPPTDILETKIGRLILTPEEQYNEQLAIVAVRRTREFKSAEHQFGLREPTSVVAASIVEPGRGLPHLPPSFNEITVDEVFDRIATTFRCVVLYGTCTATPRQVRLITFDFAPLYDPVKPPWRPLY